MFTDPSGLVPCTEDQYEQQPSIRYCILNNGGYLDVAHFALKKELADSLIDQRLHQQFGKTFGQIPLAGSIGQGAPIYHTWLYYTRLPKEGLLYDKLAGITLGIIMDFEYGFETLQGEWDFRCDIPSRDWGHCSSFSNEDLPSDYLGVVSAAKNMSLETIVTILGGGQQKTVDPENPPDAYWGRPFESARCRNGFCPNTTPFNNQCNLKAYDPITKKYNTQPWPLSLIMEPYGFGIYWGRYPSDFAVPLPTPPAPSPSTPAP